MTMRMLLIKGGGIVMKRCHNFVLVVSFFLNGWVIFLVTPTLLEKQQKQWKRLELGREMRKDVLLLMTLKQKRTRLTLLKTEAIMWGEIELRTA